MDGLTGDAEQVLADVEQQAVRLGALHLADRLRMLMEAAPCGTLARTGAPCLSCQLDLEILPFLYGIAHRK